MSLAAVAAALNSRPRRRSAGRLRPRLSTIIHSEVERATLRRPLGPEQYTSSTFSERVRPPALPTRSASSATRLTMRWSSPSGVGCRL